jgi:hypothetical protein
MPQQDGNAPWQVIAAGHVKRGLVIRVARMNLAGIEAKNALYLGGTIEDRREDGQILLFHTTLSSSWGFGAIL